VIDKAFYIIFLNLLTVFFMQTAGKQRFVDCMHEYYYPLHLKHLAHVQPPYCTRQCVQVTYYTSLSLTGAMLSQFYIRSHYYYYYYLSLPFQ
jgi:hypothetical protein